MPKQSKVIRSKPDDPAPVRERPEKFYCCRCTRSFTRQKGNFPASQSSLFKENGGYFPICKHCIDELYRHYKEVLGDEKTAIQRICLKFDIYWNEQIYEMLNKTNSSNSRVLSYISKSNLYQFVGKTYDDTLDEEAERRAEEEKAAEEAEKLAKRKETEPELTIPQEVMDFWGGGLTPDFYLELEKRYQYWCKGYDGKMDIGTETVIKQICMLEATINRDSAEGKSIDRNVSTLNTLLGSANLKPVQKKKEDDLDANMEKTPFGVWIRKIEDTRPISEPAEEFRDVDKISKYISVWFLGHLCKMLKINNQYSHLYEEEMAKLRVKRPEYESEEEEAILEDIFQRAEEIHPAKVGEQNDS